MTKSRAYSRPAVKVTANYKNSKPAPASRTPNKTLTVAVRPTRHPKSKGSVNGFFDLYIDYVKNTLLDIQFLTFFFIAFILLYSYNNSKNDPIRSLVKNVQAIPSARAFGDWLNTNIVKLIGFIAFIPGIMSIPKNKRTLSIAVSALWIWLVPEYSAYEYLAQGTVFHIVMKTNNPAFRAATIAVGIALYVMQYGVVTASGTASGTNSAPIASTTAATPTQRPTG
jgi:uncharacterized protein with PQ loop repeat